MITTDSGSILVTGAGCAEQRRRFFQMTKILRRHKAAFPDTLEAVFRAGLVFLETCFSGSFGIQRKALTDQQLVQTDGFAIGGANADMPFAVGFVRPEVSQRTPRLPIRFANWSRASTPQVHGSACSSMQIWSNSGASMPSSL